MSLIFQWSVPHAEKERLNMCSPSESSETRLTTVLVVQVALIEAGRGSGFKHTTDFEIKGAKKPDRDEACVKHLHFSARSKEAWS